MYYDMLEMLDPSSLIKDSDGTTPYFFLKIKMNKGRHFMYCLNDKIQSYLKKETLISNFITTSIRSYQVPCLLHISCIIGHIYLLVLISCHCYNFLENKVTAIALCFFSSVAANMLLQLIQQFSELICCCFCQVVGTVEGGKAPTKIKTDLKKPVVNLACHPRLPVLVSV